MSLFIISLLFFFNDTATTEIYPYLHTLSLHDALPISALASTTLPALAISFPWASNTTHSPAAFRRRNAADRALQYTQGSFSKASSSGPGCTRCPLANHSTPESRGIHRRSQALPATSQHTHSRGNHSVFSACTYRRAGPIGTASCTKKE